MSNETAVLEETEEQIEEVPTEEEAALTDEEITVEEETPEIEVDAEEEPSPEGEDGIEESLEVSIDGESPDPQEKDTTPLIRKLRKQVKEQGRELKQIRKEREAKEQERISLELGPKPDFNNFTSVEEYDEALLKWNGRKREIEEAKAEEKRKKEQHEAAFNAKKQAYNERKQSLKVPAFDDAEDAVKDSLNDLQNDIIIHAAKDPALLVYAIGKSPKKLEELSKITDPVKFTYALAETELMKLKTSTKKRKPATPPEGKIHGSSRMDPHQTELARLEKEAEKTGDRTKVLAYKHKLRMAERYGNKT